MILEILLFLKRSFLFVLDIIDHLVADDSRFKGTSYSRNTTKEFRVRFEFSEISEQKLL